MSNRNTLWAEIFVDELARAGLKAVSAAPGSRHTPLMLAFARHERIRVYSHLDERSAAFFALGLAFASDEPVALVCTSGTAAANYFPAVIEAHQSRVPLIVLTADRPHELRHSGANQTIDQVKLYGDYALLAVDAALPEAAPPAVAVRNLRTLAGRAFATANGPRKGVVHVNMPFRKPLEPTTVEGDLTAAPAEAESRQGNAPYTQFALPILQPDPETLDSLTRDILKHERGLIVCGPRCPGGDFPALVSRVAETTDYPLLADPLSGVRYSVDNADGSYDTYLMGDAAKSLRPEVILRFGSVPTSKWLNQYLDGSSASHVVHISGSGVWADDSHRVSTFVHANEALVCAGLLDRLTPRSESTWAASWQTLESTTQQALTSALAGSAYFDGAVVADVADLMPANSTLFIGNSLPIRHLDQFGAASDKPLHVYGNRGASGIDGNTSSALGAGAARPDSPLVLVTGDITFYHDMNGLLAVGRSGIPVTIVLLNNDGGGIFHRLPVSQFEPEFTEYFLTPHGLDFSHAARLYGLDYVLAESRDAFRAAFSESVSGRMARIIEVRTDSRQDAERRKAVISQVQQALAQR